jgi:chromosome partitioning protein
MFGVADYGAFVAAILIFLAIPGPGNLALITSTSKGGIRRRPGRHLRHHRRRPGAHVGGSGRRAACWPPTPRLSTRPVGWARLTWPGWGQDAAGQARQQAGAEHPAAPLFQQAAVITLLNPKAIVFYMAFFPLFVDPAPAPGPADLRRDGGHDRRPDFPATAWPVLLTHFLAERMRANPVIGRVLKSWPACSSSASASSSRSPNKPPTTKRMAKIFCVANQKGGVGKTTTTVNLSAGLAKVGQRVLMVDLDPQGNATMGSGVDKRKLKLTVYDVLLESASIAEARVRSDRKAGCGYDVLGANRELAGAEVELVDVERRERLPGPGRGRRRLRLRPDRLPAVAVDADAERPVRAHGVIVPMQCEYFALEGLSDLVNTIKQVHANLNKDLEIIGLLRVMFDPRITLQQQVSDQLKAHFGDKVFNTVIPRNVRLAEAPSYGLPGVAFDPASRGSQAFVEFAQEMVDRIKAM